MLWGWRGEPLLDEERDMLERVCAALDGDLGERLEPLLDRVEIDALRSRAERLLVDGRLPHPGPVPSRGALAAVLTAGSPDGGPVCGSAARAGIVPGVVPVPGGIACTTC